MMAMAPTPSPDDDKAWLDVLAGRLAPRDAATRRAAQLRAHFEAELAAVPDRPERVKALMNLMEAQAQGAAAARPAVQASLWQRLKGALMPAPSDGWMAVGRVALGVSGLALLVTMMLPPADPEGGDPPITKDAPGLKVPDAARQIEGAAPGQRDHAVPDPMGQGLALEAKLLALGLTVKAIPTEDGLRLKLQVPAAQREAVQALLASEGLGGGPLGDALDLVLRPASR